MKSSVLAIMKLAVLI